MLEMPMLKQMVDSFAHTDKFALRYLYDGWNNLTNTAYSDGTPSISLAYDAFGRQTGNEWS